MTSTSHQREGSARNLLKFEEEGERQKEFEVIKSQSTH